MINKLKKYKLVIFLISIFIIITIIILIFFLIKSFLNKSDNLYTKISSNKFSILENDTSALNFIIPFKESCEKFNNKNPNNIITSQPVITKASDWQKVCKAFTSKNFIKNEDMYNFIKDNFDIYLIQGKNKAHITGYYRIILNGSLTKTNEFKYPIYKIPNDLISVNLGNFSDKLKGKIIYGRVKNNKLIPYYTREEINNGVLENKNLEILWLDNKYSAFLLHIQGSGLIKINNKNIYLSYAGKNGYDFKGIYNYMKKNGYLKNTKLKGIDAIYDFFKNNPDKVDEVLNINQSYIFFKTVSNNMWFASFGTNIYEERTVAVDPSFIALGVPLVININKKLQENLVRLVVANDTGSAIKGPTRIDFYWGLGKEAEKKAVSTNNKGEIYLLLPKKINISIK